MIFKNFIVVAQEARSEKAPTRSIRAKEGDKTHYLGVGWVKKTEDGSTYLSCQMQASRATEDGKTFPGYLVIDEEEYNFLKNCEKRVEMLTSPTDGFPNGIDTAKHPLNSDTQQKAYDEELSSIGF